MKHDEFVAEVRTLADLDDNQQAEKAIRTTLETLRERLASNEPSNLADQLPEELADAVRGEGGRESFSLQEFYSRVAEKEGVDPTEAVRHARAVAAVLKAGVTTGEIDDIREQLKPEYEELFG